MIDSVNKLMKHMSRPLSLLQIELIYTSNNVVYERADLYSEFTLTLDDLIDSTYLGHDLLDERERLNHFNWCWNKTCDLINTNIIKFNNNNDAYVYFLDLYFETFYNEKSKHYHDVKVYWNYLFNYNVEKTRSDIDRFLNLYKIFEKSYKNANYLV
jgi:hypothetical protein